MKINEIKRTIEQIVTTEYIANDGTVFYDEAECLKYERSALGVVKAKLKKLSNECAWYDLFDLLSDDCLLEIYQVEDEKDLDNINQYLRLIDSCSQKKVPTSAIGFEVIFFKNYDEDSIWFYGNGTFEGFLEHIKSNFEHIKRITKQKEGIKND